MKNEIIEHLKKLEIEREIKILMAIESGSRAWGFPSPDSDYDVRIVFVRKYNSYLSVGKRKDTIDYFHGELLDINGWDIRKTLRLLGKSNATPFEWAQSPMVYMEEAGFRKSLLEVAALFFNPYHSLNHYKGIAKNSFSKITDGDQIKLKTLFYVLRPLFAIQWIQKNKTIPPMNIFELMEAVEEKEIIEKVKELITKKATANEDYVYQIHHQIKNYITAFFEDLENMKMDKKELPEKEILDTYFRNLLNQFAR